MERQKDFIVAAGGGIIFVFGWLLLDLLFSTDFALMSSLVPALTAGVAWFIGTLIFRHIQRESGPDPPS